MSKQTKIILLAVTGFGAAIAGFSGFCCVGFFALTRDAKPRPLGYTAITHEQFFQAINGKTEKQIREQFGEPTKTANNVLWCEGNECWTWYYRRLTTNGPEPIDHDSITLDEEIEIRFVDGIARHVWFEGKHYK